jgi:hypothetical protein
MITALVLFLFFIALGGFVYASALILGWLFTYIFTPRE